MTPRASARSVCVAPIESRSSTENTGRKIESESADRVARIEIARSASSTEESLGVGVARLDRSRLDRSLEVSENLKAERERSGEKRECTKR